MQRGHITMLTRNGASSYFIGSEGDTGPEYELVRGFADFLGVDLEVRVAPAFGQLSQLLNNQQGDLIAANLTRTPARERVFRFGPAYAETHIEVIYRRGLARPRTLEDLAGRRIAVIAGSSYEELLAQRSEGIEGLSWTSLEDAGIEDVMNLIARGDFEMTLVDSSIFQINKSYYPRLTSGFALSEPQAHGWAFPAGDDDTLAHQAHVFISLAHEQGRVADIQRQFSERNHQLDPVGMHQFLKQVRERLPRFLPVFEETARAYGMDWRLLAAIGYQESHWDPEAESPTGVRGLMMLTQRTARQLGLRDRLDPGQSIDGGARYFLRMHARIPSRIAEPDRTWMALAAYNMGWGHLEDARVLTQRQGGDPDHWNDVAERLPLLAQERYYTKTRYGYARGREAQTYVKNIRNYYEILMWMDTRSHPVLTAHRYTPGSDMGLAAP